MHTTRTLFASILTGLALTGCGAPDTPAPTAQPSEPGAATETQQPLVLIINYLCNGGFETADANVPLFDGAIAHGNSAAGYFAGGPSAAQCWPTTSNDLNYGNVTTWLTNEHYGSSGRSLLVAAGTNNGGVSQVYWQSTSAPPLQQKLTVRVKVLSGQVVAGIGRAFVGNFAFNYAYSQTDPNALDINGEPFGPQWETLSVCAPAGVGANQVLIYALGAPAVYYVDAASVLPSGTCP